MPVNIVVEDGSGVSGANSYGDVDGAREYASNRGVDLSGVADDRVAGWLITAMDLIESYRTEFIGEKSYDGQILQWPRLKDNGDGTTSNIEIDDQPFMSNSIPYFLLNAQYQLVIDQSNGVALSPSQAQNAIIKVDKTGPLMTEYFDGADSQPYLPTFVSWITPLLNGGPGSMFLRTVRV